MKPIRATTIALAACLVSPLAQAHDNSLTTGLFAGLAHPLTGIDHLLALILSGLLIGRLARRRHLALAGMSGALGLGAMAGVVLGGQTGVESLVLLSLPVLLALQGMGAGGRISLAVGTMGLFMVAHGWAHGVEIQGSAHAFVGGFLLSSTLVLGLSATLSRYAVMRNILPAAGRSHA